jgi:hypothetical protein
VAAPACAARGTSPQTTAVLARAEALVRQGCYLCLQEAAGILEQQASAARPSSATLTARLVEARVLEGLRQRELGVDSSQALAQARALTAALGAPRPGGPSRGGGGRSGDDGLDYAALLNLADLVSADPMAAIFGTRDLP